MLQLGFFAASAAGQEVPLSFEFGSDNVSGTNTSLYTFSNRAVGSVATEPEQRRFIVVFLTHMGNNSGAQVVPNYCRFNNVDMEMLDFINGAGNGGTSTSFWILENNESTIGTVSVSLKASSGRCGVAIWSVYSGPNGVELREVTSSISTTAEIGPAAVEPGDVVLTGAANLAGGSPRTKSGGYLTRAGSALVENTSYMAWAHKAEADGVVAPSVIWSTPAGSDSRSCMLVVLKPKAPPEPGIPFYNGSASSTSIATSQNWTINIGDATSDRMVVIGTAQDEGSEVSAVTINGVSATQIASTHTTAGGGRGASLWAAIVPTGHGNVTVNIVTSPTSARRMTIGSWSVYGRSSLTPDDTDTISSSGTTLNTGDLSVVLSGAGFMIGIVGSSGGVSWTWTGLDEDFDTTAAVIGASGASIVATAGTKTIRATQSGSAYLTCAVAGWSL